MIIISKDKILLDDLSNKEWTDVTNTFVNYLDHTVMIDDDVTVMDLFNIIELNSEVVDSFFNCSLGGHDLGDFLQDIKKDADPDDLLCYAEFAHECMMIDGKLLHTVRFGAVGFSIFEEDKLVQHSLELNPIATYKHLKLKINQNFRISAAEPDDGEISKNVLFECEKDMTLYDIFHSLLYEISFNGSPDTRDKIFEHLKSETIDNLEANDPEFASNNPQLIIAGIDVKIHNLETELNEAINMEDYETSATIRDKIKALNKKKSEYDATIRHLSDKNKKT